ncbi:hypothetical protein KAI52_01880 [Candidatus Parcubacteria bacterium]|nr:hypothetical protein [Candidatus Parcubacteria bacterium]
MLNTNQQIFNIIEKHENILIIFQQNYSGDALSSALALSMFLKKLGKNVDIVCENFKLKEKFQFLPNAKEVKSNLIRSKNFVINIKTDNAEVDSLRYENRDGFLSIIIEPKHGLFGAKDVAMPEKNFEYDLIFTLNTPDLDSLGNIFEDNAHFFYNTTIINIDYLPGNENYGQVNLIELNSSSIAEIIFSLLQEKSKEKISEQIAELILTGIIDATNSFKSLNITSKTLNSVAKLISIGADREKIVKNLCQIYSVNLLKLWGRVLARIKDDASKGIAWSLITPEDFIKTGTDESHLELIIDELIMNIPKLNAAALFYKNRDGEVKVILKNRSQIDIMPAVSQFDYRGNNSFLTLSSPDKSLIETEKAVIEKLKQCF